MKQRRVVVCHFFVLNHCKSLSDEQSQGKNELTFMRVLGSLGWKVTRMTCTLSLPLRTVQLVMGVRVGVCVADVRSELDDTFLGNLRMDDRPKAIIFRNCMSNSRSTASLSAWRIRKNMNKDLLQDTDVPFMKRVTVKQLKEVGVYVHPLLNFVEEIGEHPLYASPG